MCCFSLNYFNIHLLVLSLHFMWGTKVPINGGGERAEEKLPVKSTKLVNTRTRISKVIFFLLYQN